MPRSASPEGAEALCDNGETEAYLVYEGRRCALPDDARWACWEPTGVSSMPERQATARWGTPGACRGVTGEGDTLWFCAADRTWGACCGCLSGDGEEIQGAGAQGTTVVSKTIS